MEKKQKSEKPAWVVEIELLLPSARQNVGTIAAATIQNLGCLYSISQALFDAVIDAVNKEIYENVSEDAKDFVEDIVKDANSQE